MFQIGKKYKQLHSLNVISLWQCVGVFDGFSVFKYADPVTHTDEYRAYTDKGRCLYPEFLQTNSYANIETEEYIPPPIPITKKYDIVWQKWGGKPKGQIRPHGFPKLVDEIHRQTVEYTTS